MSRPTASYQIEAAITLYVTRTVIADSPAEAHFQQDLKENGSDHIPASLITDENLTTNILS